MKTQFIHATSSPDAMRANTGDRRFAIFTDGIDATEVQERLDWKALRDMITIDTSILEFMPTGQHQVAALANLGAELVQEVKAYRPGFLWKSSPAEIVGALIEEMAAPAASAAAPQVVEDEQAAFEDVKEEHSKELARAENFLLHWKERAEKAEAALATAPVQARHSDDIAVDRCTAAMKDKLAASRAKGRSGWDDPAQCSIASLSALLWAHMGKGDPLDVANIAMMIQQRGGSISPPLQPVTAPAASLLRPAISAAHPMPPGCHCKLGKCAAPVIMGLKQPCRDPGKRDVIDDGKAGAP